MKLRMPRVTIIGTLLLLLYTLFVVKIELFVYSYCHVSPLFCGIGTLLPVLPWSILISLLLIIPIAILEYFNLHSQLFITFFVVILSFIPNAYLLFLLGEYITKKLRK